MGVIDRGPVKHHTPLNCSLTEQRGPVGDITDSSYSLACSLEAITSLSTSENWQKSVHVYLFVCLSPRACWRVIYNL